MLLAVQAVVLSWSEQLGVFKQLVVELRDLRELLDSQMQRPVRIDRGFNDYAAGWGALIAGVAAAGTLFWNAITRQMDSWPKLSLVTKAPGGPKIVNSSQVAAVDVIVDTMALRYRVRGERWHVLGPELRSIEFDDGGNWIGAGKRVDFDLPRQLRDYLLAAGDTGVMGARQLVLDVRHYYDFQVVVGMSWQGETGRSRSFHNAFVVVLRVNGAAVSNLLDRGAEALGIPLRTETISSRRLGALRLQFWAFWLMVRTGLQRLFHRRRL